MMAPTRVLGRSCEGKLKADALRRADEEVAISFILSLRPGHAPQPHPDYSVRPAENKDEIRLHDPILQFPGGGDSRQKAARLITKSHPHRVIRCLRYERRRGQVL